jgi:hypothetical protein
MILSKQFASDADRINAIAQMRFLQDSEGWRFLVEKILQPDIDEITEEILGPIEDFAKEKDLKRKRAYWLILSQLPKKIIEALEEGKDDIVQFDPYLKVSDLESRVSQPKA